MRNIQKIIAYDKNFSIKNLEIKVHKLSLEKYKIEF